jgi:phytol kinase
MHAEILRKITHVSLALALVYIAPRVSSYGMVRIGVVLFGVFFAARVLHHFEFLRSVARTTFGEFFFAAAVIVAGLVFLPVQVRAFQSGFLVLAIADTAAALIGKRFGAHRYTFRGDSLSYEGSGTFFLVSCGIFIYAGLPIGTALISALLVTILEASAPLGSDNLFLPLATGLLIATTLV